MIKVQHQITESISDGEKNRQVEEEWIGLVRESVSK